MKKFTFTFALIAVMLSLQSCEIVEGIFKAGFWAGIILVVLVVVLIFWLIAKIRK